MNKPLASVCVVTYNHAKYISECLDSILAQETNFIFEIIVSDDASTDNTVDILREYEVNYPGIIRVINDGINVGASENYRKAHRSAKGEYIAHCDGDDYWLPGKLQSQISFLEINADCSAVYSNAKVIDANSSDYIGVFNDKVRGKFDLNYLIESSNFLNNSSLVYRTVLRDEVIPLTEPSIDYMVHVNLCEHGLLGYLNEVLVVYRANVSGSIINQHANKVQFLVVDTINSVWNKITNRSRNRIMGYFCGRAVLGLLQRNESKYILYKKIKFGGGGYNKFNCKVLYHACIFIIHTFRLKIMKSDVLFPRIFNT